MICHLSLISVRQVALGCNIYSYVFSSKCPYLCPSNKVVIELCVWEKEQIRNWKWKELGWAIGWVSKHCWHFEFVQDLMTFDPNERFLDSIYIQALWHPPAKQTIKREYLTSIIWECTWTLSSFSSLSFYELLHTCAYSSSNWAISWLSWKQASWIGVCKIPMQIIKLFHE